MIVPVICMWLAAGPKVGDVAPDLDLPTIDGSRITAADGKGKPTLLLFVAGWCPVSKRLAPAVERIAVAHPEARVMLVHIGEDAAKARSVWREQRKLTLPVLLDVDGAFAKQFAPPPDVIGKAPADEAMTGQLVVLDGEWRVRHFEYSRGHTVSGSIPVVEPTL
jgi:peroxiredoxin